MTVLFSEARVTTALRKKSKGGLVIARQYFAFLPADRLCMTQKRPLASLLPMARWVAANQKNASVNPLSPANGNDDVPHASPDLLRRSWFEHSLAMDAQPIPRQRHRRGLGLDSDAHSRQVAGSHGPQKMRPRGGLRAASSHCPNSSRRPGGTSHGHGVLLGILTVDPNQRNRRGSKKRPSQTGGLKETVDDTGCRVGEGIPRASSASRKSESMISVAFASA
jgi:hypothetical protein